MNCLCYCSFYTVCRFWTVYLSLYFPQSADSAKRFCKKQTQGTWVCLQHMHKHSSDAPNRHLLGTWETTEMDSATLPLSQAQPLDTLQNHLISFPFWFCWLLKHLTNTCAWAIRSHPDPGLTDHSLSLVVGCGPVVLAGVEAESLRVRSGGDLGR